MLSALESVDLVIGSRYVPGGTVVNWPKSREAQSRGANIYVRLMLGIAGRDATGGYRAYRAPALRALGPGGVGPQGSGFQIDRTLRPTDRGGKDTDAPITFTER